MCNYIKIENNKIIYTKGKEKLVIDIADISYCESEGNYIIVNMQNGEIKLLRCSMGQFSPFLSDANFVQVHRAFIVNVDQVDIINGVFLNIAGKKIPFPKAHRKDLFSRLYIV